MNKLETRQYCVHYKEIIQANTQTNKNNQQQKTKKKQMRHTKETNKIRMNTVDLNGYTTSVSYNNPLCYTYSSPVKVLAGIGKRMNLLKMETIHCNLGN